MTGDHTGSKNAVVANNSFARAAGAPVAACGNFGQETCDNCFDENLEECGHPGCRRVPCRGCDSYDCICDIIHLC